MSIFESVGEAVKNLANVAGRATGAVNKGLDAAGIDLGKLGGAVRSAAGGIVHTLGGWGKDWLDKNLGEEKADAAVESARTGIAGFRDFFKSVTAPIATIIAPVTDAARKGFEDVIDDPEDGHEHTAEYYLQDDHEESGEVRNMIDTGHTDERGHFISDRYNDRDDYGHSSGEAKTMEEYVSESDGESLTDASEPEAIALSYYEKSAPDEQASESDDVEYGD